MFSVRDVGERIDFGYIILDLEPFKRESERVSVVALH